MDFNTFLNEKLITFSNKAYPKFGNVVLVVGASGSGKGFQLDKIIGIEGKVFDVDRLKELVLKSTNFAEKVKTENGVDVKKLSLKNVDDVSALHDIISGVYNLPNKQMNNLYADILTKDKSRLPNLIFDVTMKDIRKLDSVSRYATKLGYKKENIHIVWVCNDIEVAIEQNSKRSRTVSKDILFSTHEGVALTMNKIMKKSIDLSQYMDGDVYISFNKVKIDTKYVKSVNGGGYIEDANYVKIKSSKKELLDIKDIDDDVLRKIESYVPKVDVNWQKGD